jgi:hypothetical protein
VGRQAMIEFKGSHFEREVILWGVRHHVATTTCVDRFARLGDVRIMFFNSSRFP